MSEADRDLGTRSNPTLGTCATCGDQTALADLSPEDECGLCSAIRNLRVTMEKRGTLHPDLFNRQLPPGDRE